MAQYSIKDVETLSGVKAHTLRIWEQRYHLLTPHRTDTNIRFYSDDQLKLLLNIATLNRSGMKISKIASLKSGQIGQEVLKIFDTGQKADDLLDSLIHCMIDFDEKRFEKTLSSAITKLGFEEAFNKLIFPFLVRTGVLWASGSIKVAQEHFISNLIRRKISAAIDGLYSNITARSKKFVLFLPEGETHELLLMFMDYVLRKNNHEVVYIGSSLPLNEIDFIGKTFKPDYLVTYQTISADPGTFSTYLKKLSLAFHHAKIIVAGQLAQQLNKRPANCVIVASSSDLLLAIQ